MFTFKIDKKRLKQLRILILKFACGQKTIESSQ